MSVKVQLVQASKDRNGMPKKKPQKLCLECGKPVILSPRSKTCSVGCKKAHTKKVKRAFYERVRETEKFKADRAAYLGELKERRAADPELAQKHASAHKSAVRKAVKKRNADPERRSAQLRLMRDWKASASEEQKEKMRAANRGWYANLSPERKAELIAAKSEKRRQRKAQN